MKINLNALFWILIIGLSACQTGNGAKHTSDRLISTNWIFLGLQHIDVKVFESVPASLSGMNIVFTRSHAFQANSSCNTAYGYYLTGDQNSIKIDSISMTKMFCADSIQIVWEDKYIAGLKSSDRFIIANDTLTLRTNSNIVLIFKAESQKIK